MTMHKITGALAVVGAIAAVTLPVSPARAVVALVSETWASEGGSDAQDCLTIASACREISAAIGKTGLDGMVHVLPGTYNAFTVTTGMEIIADEGLATIVAHGLLGSGGPASK